MRLKSLGWYPNRLVYSYTSRIDNSFLLTFGPNFFVASMDAKLDCNVFNALIASLYVLLTAGEGTRISLIIVGGILFPADSLMDVVSHGFKSVIVAYNRVREC